MKDMQSYTEIIDGFTVVHTNVPSDGPSRDRIDSVELINFYDENGNMLYANCSSLDSATDLVLYLEEQGVAAKVGKKAPVIGPSGKVERNKDSGAVGIYIINEKELASNEMRR